MKELEIPFVERESYIKKIIGAIDASSTRSNSIVLSGESGFGKTTLLQHALQRYIRNPEYTVIYLNLNADIMTSSSFFEILLFTVWNPIEPNDKRMLSIGKKQSFRHYINRGLWKGRIAKQVRQLVIASIGAIPEYGAAISSFFNETPTKRSIENNSIDTTELVAKYLKHVSKSGKIIIAIDNYHCMQDRLRDLFETCISTVEQNLSFIMIHRTEGIFTIAPPLCFSDKVTKLTLTKFNYLEVYVLFKQMYNHDDQLIQKLAEDCFNKTMGNLKEIEIYIRGNHEDIARGIIRINKPHSLKQVILLLPELQRFLVLLSAMFPAGLKIEYVSKILNNVMQLQNQELLVHEIQKLVTLGYLIINSSKHDLMKPSHDKISISVLEIADDELFLDFYRSIQITLEEMIERKRKDNDYLYMLHCIVGLYTADQLLNKMNYLIDLINHEYDNCAYYYIVNIYKSIGEIAESLPDLCIRKILDSIQKTSEFSSGIGFLNNLKRKFPSVYEKYKLYEVKYLTQLYDFDAALDEIREPTSNEELLYRLNILQHLGRDDQAKQEILNVLGSDLKDKWYYLILRNSAHYFTYEQAKGNLLQTLHYFQQSGTSFEQATAYNNLGVIELWKGSLIEASKTLNRAYEIHHQIQSNEIFEVYCNLGALEYMRGNYSKALEFTNKALEHVPYSLTLDHIVLKINRIIFECALNMLSVREAYNQLAALNQNSVTTKDPWIKFQLIYNMFHFEQTLALSHHEHPIEYYSVKNKRSIHTCFEILTELTTTVARINISICLSPNWRY